MQVRNFTPFVPATFEHFAVSGAVFLPFILKGTFNIRGSELLLSESPAPLNKSDEYYGEVNKSSVRQESDYIPFKPKTDIYFIDPIAYSPNGEPQRKWQVQVTVGKLRKTIQVSGHRQWIRGFSGWKLGEPERCRRVPIRYELAYGGSSKRNAFLSNPVGRGYVAPALAHEFAAHQIECAEERVRVGGEHEPAGLGPIARSWQPRSSLAGTYDDDWVDTKWPVMPDDFLFEHFNCGSAGLVVDGYLSGGELVKCKGLTKSGSIQFKIPDYTVFILIRCHDGALIPWRCNLDTLAINLEESKCFITWRAQLPKLPYRVVEARVFDNSKSSRGAK